MLDESRLDFFPIHLKMSDQGLSVMRACFIFDTDFTFVVIQVESIVKSLVEDKTCIAYKISVIDAEASFSSQLIIVQLDGVFAGFSFDLPDRND